MKLQIKVLAALFIFLLPTLISCQQRPEWLESLYTKSGEPTGYHFNQPDRTFKLPLALEEVSGLTWLGNDKIGCIQDEEGYFYVYDLKNQSVVSRNKFGNTGDFEAVEWVGEYVFVLKSNGELFRFKEEPGFVKVDRITTRLPFKSSNDIEGLGYSSEENKLLLALKGNSGLDGEDKKHKRVYALDPTTLLIEETPYLKIKMDDIKLAAKATDKKLKVKSFKPSAIAVHPISKHIYVLASAGKLLVIYNQKKEIESVHVLKKNIHRQPEGICFSTDGTLFIANEGGGEKGYILQFNLKAK